MFYLKDRREISSGRKILCENDSGQISCPSGHSAIQITSANYGRTEFDTCPHKSSSNLNCISGSIVQADIESDCNGQASCSVEALNSKYGDTCSGTFKYLDISYSCIGEYRSMGVPNIG